MACAEIVVVVEQACGDVGELCNFADGVHRI